MKRALADGEGRPDPGSLPQPPRDSEESATERRGRDGYRNLPCPGNDDARLRVDTPLRSRPREEEERARVPSSRSVEIARSPGGSLHGHVHAKALAGPGGRWPPAERGDGVPEAGCRSPRGKSERAAGRLGHGDERTLRKVAAACLRKTERAMETGDEAIPRKRLVRDVRDLDGKRRRVRQADPRVERRAQDVGVDEPDRLIRKVSVNSLRLVAAKRRSGGAQEPVKGDGMPAV